MTIDIQILTTTAAILDADGRTGVGTIRIRPNEPFQYNDGVTDIQVTDATVEIAVSGGQLQSALTLAPNTGASNVPTSTYYIVEVDVNTITYTEYWRLSNTPTSLEWGEVTRLPNPEDAGGDLLTAHIQSSNPHRGLVQRSDTIDAAATGTVSDGRGGIPRCDPSTGKLPASFMPSTYDAFPTGTRLLFQQTAAPTGWTKDSAAAYNSAMVVGTTGSVGSGGSADPTATHTHTGPSHTHTGPSHTHLLDAATFIDYTNVTFGGGNTITGVNASTRTEAGGTGATGSGGTGTTGANTAPKYFSVIVASKD